MAAREVVLLFAAAVASTLARSRAAVLGVEMQRNQIAHPVGILKDGAGCSKRRVKHRISMACDPVAVLN